MSQAANLYRANGTISVAQGPGILHVVLGMKDRVTCGSRRSLSKPSTQDRYPRCLSAESRWSRGGHCAPSATVVAGLNALFTV